MDEMTAVRALGNTIGPRELDPSPAVVDAFLATIAAPTTLPADQVQRSRWAARGHRLAWGLPLVAATAAVLVTATLTLGGSNVDKQSPDPSAPTALNAQTILLAAAEQARHEPALAPAADGFVYTRSTISGWGMEDNGQEGPVRGTKETWYSVDGRRPGVSYLTQEGLTPGQATATIGTCPGPAVADPQAMPESYCDGPGYLADVPSDPQGALEYLRLPRAWQNWSPFLDTRPGSADQRATDYELVTNAWFLLNNRELPPASRAAVFQALAGLPGMQVVPGPKTADGKTQIAVVRVIESTPGGTGTRDELVFDRDDHTLIGFRLLMTNPAGTDQKQIEFLTVVNEKVVVPVAGVRPDGSKVPPAAR